MEHAPDWLRTVSSCGPLEAGDGLQFGLSPDRGGDAGGADDTLRVVLDGEETTWDVDRPVSVHVSRSRRSESWLLVLRRRRHKLHVVLRQGGQTLSLWSPVASGTGPLGEQRLLSGLSWLEEGGDEVADIEQLVGLVGAVLSRSGELARWGSDDAVAPHDRVRPPEPAKALATTAKPSLWPLLRSVLLRHLLAIPVLTLGDVVASLNGGGFESGQASLLSMAVALGLAGVMLYFTPGSGETRLVERPPLVLFPLLTVFHPWFALLVGFSAFDLALLGWGGLPIACSMMLHLLSVLILQRVSPAPAPSKPRDHHRQSAASSGVAANASAEEENPRNDPASDTEPEGAVYEEVHLTDENVLEVVERAAAGASFRVTDWDALASWQDVVLDALEKGWIDYVVYWSNGRYDECARHRGGAGVRERFNGGRPRYVLPHGAAWPDGEMYLD